MLSPVGATTWSEEAKKFLREKYLLGWSDIQIGEGLNRSASAVEAKRRDMKLFKRALTEGAGHPGNSTAKFPNHVEMRMLGRFYEGIAPDVIAKECGFPLDKINEKLAILKSKTQGIPTGRRCTKCEQRFYSVHKPSVHRRCDPCDEGVRNSGSCFLTVY